MNNSSITFEIKQKTEINEHAEGAVREMTEYERNKKFNEYSTFSKYILEIKDILKKQYGISYKEIYDLLSIDDKKTLDLFLDSEYKRKTTSSDFCKLFVKKYSRIKNNFYNDVFY